MHVAVAGDQTSRLLLVDAGFYRGELLVAVVVAAFPLVVHEVSTETPALTTDSSNCTSNRGGQRHNSTCYSAAT